MVIQEGFFTSEETRSESRPDGKLRTCVRCGLYRDCKSPKMKPYGNFQKRILNIGEAPGEVEDDEGRPWQGKTGRLLQSVYKRLGIDLFEDCLNINSCNCRPMDNKGNNRAPTADEIASCRRSVLQVIDEYDPEIIVLLGGSAVLSVIGHRWKKELGGITKWRGWNIPDKDFRAWICPVYHPSFVERSREKNSVIELIWRQDLEKAVGLIGKKLPRWKEPEIEFIDNLDVLRRLKGSMITFDYETTGLKPQASGHDIICCSVSGNPNHVYSFFMPDSRKDKRAWIELLRDEFTPKMAHNMKFEDTWSKVILNTTVQGWFFDSMLAAHQLDNRQGITSLKFQAYVQMGVVDYSSEITPYLRAVDKNQNGFNRIRELLKTPGGEKKLLTYCGYDSIYENRLAELQQEIMNYNPLPF